MKQSTLWVLAFASALHMSPRTADAQWGDSPSDEGSRGRSSSRDASAFDDTGGAGSGEATSGGGARSGGGATSGGEGPLYDAPSGFSVAGLLGYTFDVEEGSLNPYAFTLGARAGYTFDLPIYVGGTMVFYAGDSTPSFFGGTLSFRMLQFGIEAGYDFALGPVVLRPFMGMGVNLAMVKFASGGMSDRDSEADFYLAFGATALYQLTDTLFVGGEFRGTTIFFEGENLGGIGLLATFGAYL